MFENCRRSHEAARVAAFIWDGQKICSIRFIEQVFQPERLDCLGKLNMEEGWVKPLLKLIKEGKMDGLVNVAQTIGLLGRNP